MIIKNGIFFEYDFDLKLITITDNFEELSIDSEWTWKEELDKKLSKILKVKKVYVMDL